MGAWYLHHRPSRDFLDRQLLLLPSLWRRLSSSSLVGADLLQDPEIVPLPIEQRPEALVVLLGPKRREQDRVSVDATG